MEATAFISFGISVIPPIAVKTILQTIDRKRINIAASSNKPNFTKKITTIGKKASTGTDSKISKIGRKIFSVSGVAVARSARGNEIRRARIYATIKRVIVANSANKIMCACKGIEFEETLKNPPPKTMTPNKKMENTKKYKYGFPENKTR